ncbi:class I SAM-dependent methyltransferase [Chishuiella sp.]|uniref:O-methyltransferase n=1 Tax=Chishuiella sp. TaxID=1969467 RepID=UPI0028ABBBD1|nr:class I SAM-dependent methyltransferase [Chishuiella sp.]
MNVNLKNEILLLYNQLKEEDNQKENRLDRWRNLEPESAEFISVIIRAQQTKNMLEIGTSNGFSTLWFADALKSTQGKLITIEIEKDRTEAARNYLNNFDLIQQVELITMDAKDYLNSIEKEFSLIFLDAERKYYTSYWENLKMMLDKKGNLLIVDNIISHKSDVEDFIELIESENKYVLSIINIGAGLLFVTKE